MHWRWVLRYKILNFFFFSRSQLILDYPSFRLCAGNDSHDCICFQTCNHDTRDDVDNHTTIFFILPTIFKLFPSVCVYHSRYWRGCLLLDANFLRKTTSFVWRNLQTSLPEQDPIVFTLKTFFSLPPSERFVRPTHLFRAFKQKFCSEIHDTALKFCSVRELQMHLRGKKLGIVMPLEYKSKYPRHC